MHPADLRFERFSKHMPETDDPVLVTLKGHLLAEEILDDIIFSKCQQPDALKGVAFSFFEKARLAQALLGTLHETGVSLPVKVWPMLDALNELRNDLAHKLESKKLATRIGKFIKTTSVDTKEECGERELSKYLSVAISFTLGYLSCFEHVAKTGEIPPELS